MFGQICKSSRVQFELSYLHIRYSIYQLSKCALSLNLSLFICFLNTAHCCNLDYLHYFSNPNLRHRHGKVWSMTKRCSGLYDRWQPKGQRCTWGSMQRPVCVHSGASWERWGSVWTQHATKTPYVSSWFHEGKQHGAWRSLHFVHSLAGSQESIWLCDLRGQN